MDSHPNFYPRDASEIFFPDLVAANLSPAGPFNGNLFTVTGEVTGYTVTVDRSALLSALTEVTSFVGQKQARAYGTVLLAQNWIRVSAHDGEYGFIETCLPTIRPTTGLEEGKPPVHFAF